MSNHSSSSSSIRQKVKKSTEHAVRKLPFVPSKAHEYTWEELEKLEKRRRQVLTRVELGFWEILGHWDGTCLRFLATDGLLWLTILTYIALRFLIRYNSVPTFVESLGNGDVSVIGGFLSFFLVVFVNKSHIRFFKLYENVMACKGRIFDVATLSVSYLPKTTATRIVRYMNAAHVSGYVGLSKVYPSSTFFSKMNDDLGLLTDQELDRMKEMNLDKGGSCNRELIAWALHEVQQVHAAKMIDDHLAHEFRDHILRLRAEIGKLYNAADMPIPFFYVHFICLLTALYLPLFALSIAFQSGTGDSVYWAADVVGGLLVLFQSMFVIGLRILGQKMNDPFGDDLIDLSVIFYCVFNWRMSNRVLETKFPIPADSDEGKLQEGRHETLGQAWEAPTGP